MRLRTFILMTTLVLLPVSSYAQEEAAASATSTTDTSAVTAPALSTPQPLTQATSTVIQTTIDANLLEQSVNPQQGTLEAAIHVIDQATESASKEIMVTASTTETGISLPQATSTEVVETLDIATTTEVAQIPAEDLTPKKEYTFSIEGESIATKETPAWSQTNDSKAEEDSTNTVSTVTEAPQVDTDSTPHALEVSGSCSEAYYVILIYKTETDYDNNPSSYIFNKAYPCIAGQYSYKLSELPFNLESGTFYLLVGGQGMTGSWKPITALIPIGITVKTIVPVSSSTTSNESAQ